MLFSPVTGLLSLQDEGKIMKIALYQLSTESSSGFSWERNAVIADHGIKSVHGLFG